MAAPDDIIPESQGNNICVAVRCRPFIGWEHAEASAGEHAFECQHNSIRMLERSDDNLGRLRRARTDSIRWDSPVKKANPFGTAADDNMSPLVSRSPSKVRRKEEISNNAVFTFDNVFGSDDSQEKVFDVIGVQLIQNAISAYNSCLFAYGQTGSGKTHSIVGDVSMNDGSGILPRACMQLFKQLAEKNGTDLCFQATVLASYLEIYNEKLQDLLTSRRSSAEELQVRLHPQLGAIVANLVECPIVNYSEALELLKFGSTQRAVGATQMNAVSSRSHAVFTLQIRTLVASGETKKVGLERQAKIHFVDLAGSERQKKSGASGGRLQEAICINQSLTTLARVISHLTKANKTGIAPFRDSKLTWLLRDALVGNSRTVFLACISPSKANLDESLSTLEFASRCKLVKTSARKNEQSRDDVIAKLANEQELVEAQLQQEKAASEDLCMQLRSELAKAAMRQVVVEQALKEKTEIEEKLRLLDAHQKQEIQQLRRHMAGNSLPAVGVRVVATYMEQEFQGTVRHAGEVQFTSGDVVGVELDDAVGKNDGMVEGVRYFSCAQNRGLFVRPEKVQCLGGEENGDLVSVSKDILSHPEVAVAFDAVSESKQKLRERLAELEKEELALQEETQHQDEQNAQLEEKHRAQVAREQELEMQVQALRCAQESWALDACQLEAKREQWHRHRELELKKLGLLMEGIDPDNEKFAPKLVNLNPDPALKGSLVYYLPIGQTIIGSDAISCRVCLVGLNIGAEVCVIANKSNEDLFVRPLGGGLVRVNGVVVGDSGQDLCDGDRLAIGRAHIFCVQVPKVPKDEEVAIHAETEFERAMDEIAACAEVGPQWENGIQKAMMLVKNDFGTNAANKLLGQARKASEACEMANAVLQQMPAGWTDGVAKFDLSVMFDAHGLPEVCVVARRSPNLDDRFDSNMRSGCASCGIWGADYFCNERLPIMQDALTECLAERFAESLAGRVLPEPGPRHWECRVWGKVGIEDYRLLAAELALSEIRRQEAEACASAATMANDISVSTIEREASFTQHEPSIFAEPVAGQKEKEAAKSKATHATGWGWGWLSGLSGAMTGCTARPKDHDESIHEAPSEAKSPASGSPFPNSDTPDKDIFPQSR